MIMNISNSLEMYISNWLDDYGHLQLTGDVHLQLTRWLWNPYFNHWYIHDIFTDKIIEEVND